MPDKRRDKATLSLSLVVLTGLAVRALAVKTADTVDTGSAVEAGRTCTVVDVDATVRPGPAVHANTRVAAVRIRARGAVMAQGRPHGTLVHVELALRARESRRTQTGVLVHPVHACRTVLTEIARTVVDVLLAVIAPES